MNSKRLYFLLITIIVLTVVGTSTLIFYSNKYLSNESVKLNTARSMGQKNTLLDLKYKQISANSKYWQEPSRDLYTTINDMLPTSKGQAEAIGLIQKLAEENSKGFKLNSITFPTSELGAAKAAATTTTTTDTSTPSPTPTPAAKITQTKVLKDVNGILAIEAKISLKPIGTGTIDYQSFLKFLDGLTNNTRLMQVTELSVSSDLKGADIIVNILVKQ